MHAPAGYTPARSATAHGPPSTPVTVRADARSSHRGLPRVLALLTVTMACAPLRSINPAATPTDGVVQRWITTPDRARLLHQLPPLPLSATRDVTDDAVDTHIDVDTTRRFQSIVGFGAALTDASAWVIQTRLTASQREALLQELFGRDGDGIGLSFVRITIGASDFSRSHYTFDDVPPGTRDDSLRHFSIRPHAAEVLPVLRRARAINPALTVMATPWSAPAWMKTSGALIGGTLRDDAYPAYAAYLHRAVTAYDSAAVPIALLSVQNEPHFEPKEYPGMRFRPEQRQRFVGEFLGPLFERAKVRTQLLDWDHNWDEPTSPLAVLRDSVARRHIAGVAWHCYAGEVSAQSVVHDAFPDADTYFTECAGGAWAPRFADNLQWNVKHLVIGTTRHWARGVALWNLALDEKHGPHLGGCNDCRGVITIDSASGVVTRNEEYYALAHASRFVLPGARRIASTSDVDSVETVAFRNPDGMLVLVAVNAGAAARTMRVATGSRTFRAAVPPGAVVTFRWR